MEQITLDDLRPLLLEDRDQHERASVLPPPRKRELRGFFFFFLYDNISSVAA